MDRVDPRLLKAFYQAALFLRERVERDGWKWSSNYLREHARCATPGVRFTNSESPKLLRALLRAHPELGPHIRINPLKNKAKEKT